jgi:type IV secretion system protein VirB10
VIPQGSRLIGRYDSVVAFGQQRALVIWQRVIRPDGSSILIDNLPQPIRVGALFLSPIQTIQPMKPARSGQRRQGLRS